MSQRELPTRLDELNLASEFEDLEGLLNADLQAIVSMLTERARERLLLTRRETASLRSNLWNGLVGSIQEGIAPLSAEWR
jgi:hypothetical protein